MKGTVDRGMIVVVGILSITTLEGIALLMGVNGIILTGAIGTVSALVGWAFGRGGKNGR